MHNGSDRRRSIDKEEGRVRERVRIVEGVCEGKKGRVTV